MAVENLSPPGTPHEIVGDVVRFTLVYNEGAAMGIPTTRDIRTGLGVFGVLAGLVLLVWYRRISPEQKLLPAALGLLLAGALGNSSERIFSPRGVVDFIDLGWGAQRFYIFNVADIGVTAGAILLGLYFWNEERSSEDDDPRPAATPDVAPH